MHKEDIMPRNIDAVRFNAKGEVIVPFHRVGHVKPDLSELLLAVSKLPKTGRRV